ncbi:MAG: FAD-dependent oxidoreductase [Ardenticatenaceae bacterium]|nr:FAD-dependent oxidoreductase [Ardenticatenaceae bacterium]
MIERVDVAVVGAGPGGLSAAQAAAQAGARVALIESHRHPGGQYFRQPVTPRGRESSARQRQGQALWEQAAAAGAQLLLNTVVWGLVEGNPLRLALHTAQQAAALLKIEAQALILATGAHDRPVAFPSWTLPGVITAGAAQTLLKEQGVSPGTRVLLAGTGPLQLVVAADLVRAGVEVVGVLEGSRLLRDGLRHAAALWGQWERLDEGLRSSVTLRRHHVPLRNGWGIVAAEGREQVERATIARLDEQWRPISGSEETLACDTVCLGYGFIPLNTLSRLVGAWQEWRPDLGGEVPVRDARMQTSVPGVYAVGDGAGIGGAALAMVEGRIAGIAAAAGAGHGAAAAETAIQQLAPPLARERRFQQMYAALFTPGPGLYELSRDDTILCRCEEVTQAEVRRAVARGADSTGEVKAITRCGMGNCQGRMCSHLVAHCVARETGRSVAEVGLFRPRPPSSPSPLRRSPTRGPMVP